jgi:ABC-2 type transport system permease protein
MKAGRIAAVVRRHSYGAINSPTRLIILAFWPIVDLVVWGLVTTFLRGAGTELPVPVSFFLGGILLWDLVFRTKNAVAFCLLEENWSRNLISVMASPVTPGEYLGGAVAFGLIQVLTTLALISVLAWAMFAFGVLALGPMLTVYAAVLIVFGISLALVVIACVLRIGYSADELTWVLAASLLPFCAVFYPVAALPGWAQTVAWFMPPAHVFELMRAHLADQEAAWGNIWTAIALDLVYLAAAFAFARSMFAAFLRRGLITRYM